MNDKKQFLSLLTVAKRKLFLEHFSRYLHVGLLIAAIMVFCITFSARFFVILYVIEKLLWITGVILLITFVVAYIKKPTNQLAANLYDNYVKEDRVKSALTFLEDNSVICALQRQDALRHMKQKLPEIEGIKINLLQWKRIGVILLPLVLSTISIFIPNEVMKTAQQQEIDKEIVEETKEDIYKLIAEKEKYKDQQLEELKKETKDLKTSEELLNQLLAKEASLEEKKQLAKEDEQLLKDLALAMNEFNDLSKALDQANSEKMKKALEDLFEKFPSLSEQQLKQLENLITQVTGEKITDFNELSDEQLKNLIKSLEKELNYLIASTNSLNQLASLQQQVQQLATTLNQNMAKAGLSNSNQLTFASQNQGQSGQNQQGQAKNSTGQGQNGTGNGQGQGQGNGNGSGAGSGQGNGSGNGAGFGSGSSSGAGAGVGLGQGSRELTIPEKITGNENIENDTGELGEGSGQQQIAPEAPVLKGTIRPYDEVYGEYERLYRESVEKMDLPAYLEEVVKGYFSELNPEGE